MKNIILFVFKGNLGLDYVPTKSHPVLYFPVEGRLVIGEFNRLIRAEGELHHLSNSGRLACILGIKLPLSLNELDIELPLEGVEDQFEASISQTLLHHDKN